MLIIFLNLLCCANVAIFLPAKAGNKEFLLLWLFTTIFITIFERYTNAKNIKKFALNHEAQFAKEKALLEFQLWQVILKVLLPITIGFFYAHLKNIATFFFSFGYLPLLVILISSVAHIIILFMFKKSDSWLYYLFWLWAIISYFRFGYSKGSATFKAIYDYYSAWCGLLNFFVEGLEIIDKQARPNTNFKKSWDKFWRVLEVKKYK